MSAGDIAAKVAPKTIFQFRNVCYAFAAWWGLTTGVAEKMDNDRLWGEVRAKEVAARVDHENALAEQRLKMKQKKSGSKIPEVVPPELHDLYKTITAK